MRLPQGLDITEWPSGLGFGRCGPAMICVVNPQIRLGSHKHVASFSLGVLSFSACGVQSPLSGISGTCKKESKSRA